MNLYLPQTTTAEEGKQEKKADQPPQAKKPKVKTKIHELPIENSPQWQLAIDMLNLFVENEVRWPCKMTAYLIPLDSQMCVGFVSCSCCVQGKMIMQDKLEKERNDAKNTVEEYVYDMRDKMHGMYEKFIVESVSTLLKVNFRESVRTLLKVHFREALLE